MVYNKDMNILIKEIKKIMIDKDINNNELSLRMDKSKQHVSNLLSSRQDNININLLCDLVNACDCDLIIDILPKVKW